MLSLIQGEVVTKYHWLTTQQFTDIVAISQMTPGPIGINSATYVGYTAVTSAGYPSWAGVLGSALATISVILPSFILMYTITKFLLVHRDNRIIDGLFSLLRPTVVGLIGAAALLLMTPENFSSASVNPWQFYISVYLFLMTFVGTYFYKINPIRMILTCGLAGLLLC